MGPSVGYTPFNLWFFTTLSVLILILKAWNNRPVFSKCLQHRASFLTPARYLFLGFPQTLLCACEHRFMILFHATTVSLPEACEEHIIWSTRLKLASVLNNQIGYNIWRKPDPYANNGVQIRMATKLMMWMVEKNGLIEGLIEM